MINTHEILLTTSAFNQFTTVDYLIVESDEIEINDYVLVKQVEQTGETELVETGLYRMTQVKNVVNDPGLKDGYVLLLVQKL